MGFLFSEVKTEPIFQLLINKVFYMSWSLLPALNAFKYELLLTVNTVHTTRYGYPCLITSVWYKYAYMHKHLHLICIYAHIIILVFTAQKCIVLCIYYCIICMYCTLFAYAVTNFLFPFCFSFLCHGGYKLLI